MPVPPLAVVIFGLYCFGAGVFFGLLRAPDPDELEYRMPLVPLALISIIWLPCVATVALILVTEKVLEWCRVIRRHEEETRARKGGE
jgi:hypothetical protein